VLSFLYPCLNIQPLYRTMPRVEYPYPSDLDSDGGYGSDQYSDWSGDDDADSFANIGGRTPPPRYSSTTSLPSYTGASMCIVSDPSFLVSPEISPNSRSAREGLHTTTQRLGNHIRPADWPAQLYSVSKVHHSRVVGQTLRPAQGPQGVPPNIQTAIIGASLSSVHRVLRTWVGIK
jgi:hypothetical protein